MNPRQVFKNNFDGPYPFKYRKDGKFSRPCYIINGYESGLFNLYCPAVTINGVSYPDEFNLGKSANQYNGDSLDVFVSFGRNHYLN